MKLYYGGYGNYQVFAVAEDEQSAIKNIGAKINAPFLPITAEEILGVDGYIIQAVPAVIEPEAEEPAIEPVQIQTETPVEAEKPATLRHCKQCDFTCENQGDLLRHYKTVHGKNKGD